METRDDLRLLCTAQNHMGAQMRAGLLRDAGIPCIIRAKSSYLGSAAPYTGGWFAPQELYVCEEDYAPARALMEECFPHE